MTSEKLNIYKYLIGPFSISDAFDVSDFLLENGFLSASCLEADNFCWNIEALSEKKISNHDMAKILGKYKFSVLESTVLPDIDWLKQCFENFKPMNIGSFYVHGEHIKWAKKPKDKVIIEIAAATAFGSGEHATTRNCLLACCHYYDALRHKKVLDLGCGSGILGIALAKLGARDVYAFDNDLEAVRVASDNAKINRVDWQVHVQYNSGTEFSINKYDFIVANILSEPLISLSQYIYDSLNPDGILVLSGFLASDVSVVDCYKRIGLVEKYIYKHQEWAAVVFEKKYR